MSTRATVRIGDLGRVVTGRTPPSAEPAHFRGDIPFLTPSDIDGEHRLISTERSVSSGWDTQQARISLPAQAVCVVCIGATIGKVCMTAIRSQSNQQINSIIVDEKRYDPLFVYYSLRLMRDELRQKAAGAATPILNKSAFSDLTIDVPILDDQRRIGSILGAYDDLIEVNRRRIALMEEMARRLFEEWFVRFRFPGHDGHAMVQMPDGPRPQGWQDGVLGDLIALAYGRSLIATARQPGSIPVIGSSGVVGWHNEALVNGPGIVVGRKGNVGSIIWSPSDFYPIDTVFFVETQHPLRFVLHQLRRLTFLNSDAAVPGLNRKAALSIPLTIPPQDLMTRYDEMVTPMLGLAEQLRRSNILLASSRDLLLPSLASGELSVSAAERELEAVA